MLAKCDSDNAEAIDQSSFWSEGSLNWDAHRTGWLVAGVSTIITVLISVISVLHHARSYTNPRQQRQIIRILYMPLVYGVISFLSYRFFRDYTYYSLVQVVYEAFTIAAFLMLLIEYVKASSPDNKTDSTMERKEKPRLLLPLCCWRYRPKKAYFMYTVKWSVLQYCIVRPAVSIAGIILETHHLLCESEGFNFSYANVYLEIVDFISISIALYGLLLFYNLTKEELSGKRPFAKFLSIKAVVMLTWKVPIFGALEGRVIKPTEYWTTTNIANGLNALAMIFFSILMMWAFSSREFRRPPGQKPTSIWRPLWDRFVQVLATSFYSHLTKHSINFSDFAYEVISSLRFYLCGVRTKNEDGANFAEAFGIEDADQHELTKKRAG
ncbi:hypothetical protein MKEN_00657800 [Mycena kentingensis (nom. inval.)]|nr:hypothetical protein MKEN_00657800 [Mycena kentingensis (nom. inval.)]